jgi:hypothetical protein
MNINDTFEHLKYNIVTDDYGNIRYYNKDGQLHRENDKPAVIDADGTQEWWMNGNFIK